MRRFFLSLTLTLAAVSAWCEPREVAVVTSQTAVRLEELVTKIILAPQWLTDTEVSIKTYKWDDWKETEYGNYSAVFFLVGDGTATGLKLMNFTPEQGAAAEAFVRGGGTLFVLADRSPKPGSMKSTASLASVLGMGGWGPVKSQAEVPAEAPAEAQALKENPDILRYTFAPTLNGLNAPTTAKVLVGSKEGALVTVNRLGEGKAVFASAHFTGSGTPQYSGKRNASPSLNQFFPVAKLLFAQLDKEKTAFKKVKREIWDVSPLGPKVSEYPAYTKRTPVPIHSARKLELSEGGRCTLVRDGKPLAVIVVADGKPGYPARNGAAVINDILKKMTGCSLPVKSESALKGVPPSEKAPYVVIGKTSLTPSDDYPANGLSVEVSPSRIAVNGANLTVAAMRFMQEFTGYQMLWPGKEGEVYSVSTTLEVPAGKLTDAPFFPQRSVRNYLYRTASIIKRADGTEFKHHFGDRVLNGCKKLDFDIEKLPAMWEGYRQWWSANCLGGDIGIGGGGLFKGWDKKQAKGHRCNKCK